MKQRFTLPPLSLRLKLMLSYLLVALGAILVLAIVVSLAVQNYFASSQRELLRADAEDFAQQVGIFYRAIGGNWGNAPLRIETNGPKLIIIVDASGTQIYNNQPRFLPSIDQDESLLTQALTQALQGQVTQGHIAGSSDDTSFSGLYIGLPLHYNGQANGQVIGAMLEAVPEQYPTGFSPNDFVVNVNQAILITGAGVALVVVLFSLLLVRRLTRPLEALTTAADQVKQGDYTKRVDLPRSKDELGRLALTFNAMAETIESDVTELRRQEQLRRDLLANIAHDLATPLTAIQGFSEALADDVISDAEARQETAQLIGREVQRLRRLVGDMQNMTSLESGRAQLDLAPLDLHALVDETLAVIRPECEQAGITVQNEIPPTTPPVLADSDRITQVLLNLLDNARRHTPEGGRLTVGARPVGNKLTVCISDTGTGIDPAGLLHIFERFYRVDRARTASAGGSGLGLAIVKAIITAHGGTIAAESNPGQGTRILFSLPLAPRPLKER
jgi:signal transduction histidine kinase